MLICVSDRSKSGHYYATGQTTPTMTTPVSILFPGYHPPKKANKSKKNNKSL